MTEKMCSCASLTPKTGLHELKRGTGIHVDHYNIEIQVPVEKSKRYTTIENYHIVVDENLKFVEAYSSKNGVLKNVPKLHNTFRP